MRLLEIQRELIGSRVITKSPSWSTGIKYSSGSRQKYRTIQPGL